ncbi:MAG TPA: ABC transporter permease [Blastocatellia bacterium]|nr:ABC transporter permease [Blastocatellia bacterium]HMX25000.1 ABC transporter permease [Blastocatellia bacterium]HMZ19290.1 ABC transporter permease [Blastocatellia bacterium]HNG32747.1 ABC transporter permease [Blastocatellia bacterium]
MHFIEAIKLAMDAIHSHKLRSFLTLLGVIFGVATVIVVVSLIEGFNKYVDEKIANIGTNAFTVQKFAIEDFSSLDAYEQARRHNKDVTMDDLAVLRAAAGVKNIKDVGAQEQDQCELKFGKESLIGVSLIARTSNMLEIQNTEIAEGRSFSPAEEMGARLICYIGADVAEKFFPTTSPLGQKIKIDGRPFEVIGVAKALGSVFGQSRDKFVSIPMTTFLNIYGSRRSIQLFVASTSAATYEDAIDEARVIMRTRRKLPPNEKDTFGIITPSAVNNLREKIFGTIQVVAIGVTSIALVVGGIVIMNIMLVSVTERTKEIGIRKSLGARRKDILRQFLVESTIQALVGGAIGVSIAWALGKLVSTLTPIPTSLPMIAVAAALLVSGGVGIIAGIYPAWRAASLDPIKAMRAD